MRGADSFGIARVDLDPHPQSSVSDDVHESCRNSQTQELTWIDQDVRNHALDRRTYGTLLEPSASDRKLGSRVVLSGLCLAHVFLARAFPEQGKSSLCFRKLGCRD